MRELLVLFGSFLVSLLKMAKLWPHLAVGDRGVEDSCKALTRCSRHLFNHSAKSYMLKQKKGHLQYKQVDLVQDVVTRWNSARYKAERILSQQQPLCAALLELRKGDLMPSDTEFTTLELFNKVMQPLVQIMEAIGAEKWVTISTVRPLLYKLLSVLFVSGEDTSLEKSMKQAMHSNLSDRYTGDLLMMLIHDLEHCRFFQRKRDLLFFLQLRR